MSAFICVDGLYIHMPPKRRSPKKSRSPKKARATRRVTNNMYYTMLPKLSYPGPYYTPKVTNASSAPSAVAAVAVPSTTRRTSSSFVLADPEGEIEALTPEVAFDLPGALRNTWGYVTSVLRRRPTPATKASSEASFVTAMSGKEKAEQYRRRRRVATRSPKKRSPAQKARTTRRSPRRSPRKTRR